MSLANAIQTDSRVGQQADLVPFARVRWWTGGEQRDLHVHELEPGAGGLWQPARDPQTGEWHIGLEWEEPRDVCQVVARYVGLVPPNREVHYWQKNWPTPAPERRQGARRGWIGRDDPYHGQWITVRAEQIVQGSTCTWTFDPLDLAELKGREAAVRLEEAEHYLPRFRRALKLRLVCGGEEQPVVAALHAYSSARWRQGGVQILFGVEREASDEWSGWAEAFNGYVLGVQLLDRDAGDSVESGKEWRCRLSGRTKGVCLHLLYTDAGPTSADRTIVTIHTQVRTFSFLLTDLDHGPIYIKDYGVFIAWAGSEMSFEEWQVHLAAMPKSIYGRVLDEPEHSLARAMREIPPLDVTKQDSYTGLGRYLPLGVEAGRQEWALRHNGDLFADKILLKLVGRDAARLLWPGHHFRFRFGSGDPPFFHEGRSDTQQSVLDGWLPVVISRWCDREIAYEQTAFVALLDGPMTSPDARRGDEDVVAWLRFVIRNATHGHKRAHLWVVVTPQEHIELQDNLVVALGRVVPADPVARQWRVDPYGAEPLRCVIHTGGRGSLAAVPYADEKMVSHAISTAILYSVDLQGGESHTLTMVVPFIGLTGSPAWQKVVALDFDRQLADVLAYWQGYVRQGGQVDLPDRVLSDFHKAVRVHVAITADKDPVSGLIALPAATCSYGVCANEAGWQIMMLDQAGHHGRAEAYLETFLATQGMSWLDGDFSSNEGVMQGLDLDAGVPCRSSFAYNLDVGTILECMAYHYHLTGDRDWLSRVAFKLIAACDFVIRERRNTRQIDQSGRPVAEWGLLPAGHLEDNPEWRHWFAVNAHAYNGLRGIAEALAEIDHPEAERLAGEATAYREDIRRAVRRAMYGSPVVRLLDGTCVPHVPTRTGVRGREWGWFREAAYGAVHLLEANVFDPDEEEMTWVLQDLEDNLFVSREWGRPVDLEKRWFSHGGVTIQPNLMDLGPDYLRRGQVKHALRALFNNFGASLYPDVRVFAEHPVVELGHGVGPFFKSSDESKALVWLRAFLIWEEGTTLHLARGVPRAWFVPGQKFGVRGMATRFGPLTYQIKAGVSEVVIHVDIPDRCPPKEVCIHVRLPEGQEMQAVTVGGQPHAGFDPIHETVCLMSPSGSLRIQVKVETRPAGCERR